MRYIVLVNSFLFGIGLAFESFMVALANGLNNASGSVMRGVKLAALFAVCHVIALIIGCALVKTVVGISENIDSILTYAAAAVLFALGVKMIIEGSRASKEALPVKCRTAELILQSAVASFDAFAVGLTVSDYTVPETAVCAAVIFSVITAFYVFGFTVGKKFGVRFGKYAAVIGGLVFIGVAAEIAVGVFWQ